MCNLQWLQNSTFKISQVFSFTILTLGLRYMSPPISCLANLWSSKRWFVDGRRDLIGLEFGLSHRAMWPHALMLKCYGLFRFSVFQIAEMQNMPLDNSMVQIFLWSDGPDLIGISRIGTSWTLMTSSSDSSIPQSPIYRWRFPFGKFRDFFDCLHAS